MMKNDMNDGFFDKVSHSLISFKAISNNIQMTDINCLTSMIYIIKCPWAYI